MEAAGADKKKASKIDPAWEFHAPKYYDFVVGETEEEKVEAEKWLDAETSCDVSPHVGKSKTVAELLHLNPSDEDMDEVVDATSPHENKENQQQPDMSNSMQTPVKNISEALSNEAGGSAPRKTLEERPVQKFDENSSSVLSAAPASQQDASAEAGVSPNTPNPNEDGGVRNPERTPLSVMPSSSAAPPCSLPAKRLHPHGWKEDQASGSLTMPKLQNPSSARQFLNGMKKKDPHCRLRSMLSPDNNPPAHKKQKLDEGRLRQIKERIVRSKESSGLTVPQEFQFCTEKRSRVFGGAECSTASQGGRPPSPFVSLAEKVRRFQTKTPERFYANTGGSQELDDHERRKLKLTKPKTPEFETSHRTRQIKVKSTAELEQEMLAKVPKFKARPAPKKILDPQPPLTVQKPALPPPEFQEFHLRTNERALQHKCDEREVGGQQQGTSAVATSMDSIGAELKRRRKSAPGVGQFQIEPPHLLTATRTRPITVKSREELEIEEIAKMPKFKARPLNKRIFESRGELGVYRNNKREVTQIEEFRFATDQRLKHHEQPSSLADVFSKMCLSQQHQANNLRPTVPEPFHLETENRGVLKEMKFMQEVLQREQDEIKKRVPKAHPLPFTTDIPAIPPKPEPKEATRPEPFQLESVVRHMDEQQRLAEERKRAEEIEAALKAFRAQPNLSNAPVFMPFRSRKPLTDVQEFQFHLDSRATERAEFEKMLQEKQNQYKRFREECEAVRKAEEEKIIKALRKEMVPHARPMPVYGRPFVPQRSSKEPTRPVAPALLTETLTRRPTSQRRRSSMTSTAQMRRRMGQIP
ncbi:hypothetical protein R1sor_005749 [Riccia sorocarpa]|uniref:Targeting protein for Xklp2 n=1 Tax=Riccia sorocarpa TaxID=122646 RepID=A0ABD3HL35_9MARC